MWLSGYTVTAVVLLSRPSYYIKRRETFMLACTAGRVLLKAYVSLGAPLTPAYQEHLRNLSYYGIETLTESILPGLMNEMSVPYGTLATFLDALTAAGMYYRVGLGTLGACLLRGLLRTLVGLVIAHVLELRWRTTFNKLTEQNAVEAAGQVGMAGGMAVDNGLAFAWLKRFWVGCGLVGCQVEG
eukprot:CAMPEP_0202920560 /NCGR_PEP_ID=MMETSP1392-20130828/76916_1 /ASSEMBLY_ACC=CAM_ASM_000868 /TAXON_ID=225041 /ORGANISM="Chlamydomonas chlamydogama, Strain SAG 11-48b" /LENGTH=184 /DNA_ID=CAMNT_0049614063 /DNA_START=252 /DNA_END=807 /DNA_ORIENTATION=-